jgi:hypothetical protein
LLAFVAARPLLKNGRMFHDSKIVSARLVLVAAPVWLAAVVFTACGGGGVDTAPSAVTAPAASTTTPATSTGGTTASTSATLAYDQDIKPIFDSDCVMCHGPNIHENNVRLDSYANVLRVVSPGNARSLLVQVTRSNGIMYPNLTGDRATKSAQILAWVVNNNAAQTR